MPHIDLNCDMGEGFGPWKMGADLTLLKYITSANIACGFHAGDPDVMYATVKAAVAAGVKVGAHPGLPDLQGFGRRAMAVSPEAVRNMVIYQVGAMQGFARALGTPLHHVKTHGALYNMTARDTELATAVAQGIAGVDRNLVVYVGHAAMADAARECGLPIAFEVFADRTYQDDGTLTPRSAPNAMIEDVDIAIAQVRRMVHEGVVRAVSGKDVRIQADTLCIHGDQPGATVFAQRIRDALSADGIQITASR